jgi:non-ribosomal peptide synthetase component E (peptide arylation enzyme)
MPNVKDALRSYAAAPPMLGQRPPADASRTRQLTRRLEAVSRVNGRYFAICFGAVLALFVLSAVVAVRFLDSPQTLTALFAALGITVTGLISQMASLWKQKVMSDTLLALAAVATEEQLSRIIDDLLKRL